jgi:hypothetical protein
VALVVAQVAQVQTEELAEQQCHFQLAEQALHMLAVAA